jgi:hypothetical protein
VLARVLEGEFGALTEQPDGFDTRLSRGLAAAITRAAWLRDTVMPPIESAVR